MNASFVNRVLCIFVNYHQTANNVWNNLLKEKLKVIQNNSMYKEIRAAIGLSMVLVKISTLFRMRRLNSISMNEKRTSDKGQHSCRDAFVLLFICPMNGISFRKRHRVLCPLLIYLFCSSFCTNFFWRILIFHFSHHKSTLI